MTVADRAARGLLPDALIRPGLRRLLRGRVAELAALADDEAFVAALRKGQLAESPELGCGWGSLTLWRGRWPLFFLECSDLFGYRAGSEGGVSHSLLERPR